MKCFTCQHEAKPYDCGNITDCSPDEDCFIQQLVTATGNIVYNSGCIPNTQCTSRAMSMFGKRLKSVANKRSPDIQTCFECCKSDFCNRKGCGVQETPLGQRGPYCFNCHTLQDPAQCKNVLLCDPDEMCIVFSEERMVSPLQTNIGSRCVNQKTCDGISQTSYNTLCVPYCCKTDFCNNHCGERQTTTVTTRIKQTTQSFTTSSLQPVITTMAPTHFVHATHKPHCDTRDGYVHLHTGHTHMCVHMVHLHVNWHNARVACKNESGELVVLDTHEKAVLLRNELKANYSHSGYWIGLKNWPWNDKFQWVNTDILDDSEADWDIGQPDYFWNGVEQKCVGVLRKFSFRWHDLNCIDSTYNYICER